MNIEETYQPYYNEKGEACCCVRCQWYKNTICLMTNKSCCEFCIPAQKKKKPTIAVVRGRTTTEITIFVAVHAIQRFRERTKSKRTDDYIRNLLQDMVAHSEEVEHKHPSFFLRSLMNHKWEKAQYRRHESFIFVMVENRVLTVYTNECDRWRPKKNYNNHDMEWYE